MVEGGGTEWHQTNRGVSIYISIYLSLFVLVAYFSKLLHDRPKIGAVLPEAAMIIIVGMAAGFIIHLAAGNDDNDASAADDVARSLLSFSPTAFFVLLLPPIIFNSGYHLRRDLFFRHIGPICLYACVGTVICAACVALLLYAARPLFGFAPTALELLAFGALISATDPVSTLAVFSAKKVDPHLFYLVFGESVINDAVGLVLFEALVHLIEANNEQPLNVGQEVAQFLLDFVLGFGGSLALGTLFAIGVALFLKRVDMRNTPLLELSVYVTIMYFSFCVAEICRLSGIVTVLFCGIAAKRYCEPNLSAGTAMKAQMIFRLAAHFAETLIFIELGLSVADLVMSGGAFCSAFIGVALLACLVGRVVNIYPLTALINLAARRKRPTLEMTEDDEVANGAYTLESGEGATSIMKGNDPRDDASQDSRISLNKAHMLWFSGLRGAVSYALVKTFPNTTGHQTIFVVTTAMIVLLTTFVFGGTTDLMLRVLRIPMDVDEATYMQSVHRRKLLGERLHRFESVQIRSWLIRGFDKKTKRAGGNKTLLDDDDTVPVGDDDSYIEQIEVTETEYLEAWKRHNSIYNYGR
ncbi:hypothetical protein ACHAXT_008986 [Thalassiosira profunda]